MLIRRPIPGHYRDVPLTLRPNPVLETGRVSYDGVIQLFKRQPGHFDAESGEWVPSLRECIEARPGHVLGSIDYDSGELITHAQSCIWITGFSKLAKALVDGLKPHNALGATMIGLSYEEFDRQMKDKSSSRFAYCKNARQAAKPPNFGYPGGMGAVKLVLQQRKQGPNTPHPNGPSWVKDDDGKLVRGYKGLRFCLLMDGTDHCGGDGNMLRTWKDRKIPPTCKRCIECAVRLKQVWQRQWPENTTYFQFIQACVENGQAVTGEMLARWPHLRETFVVGQRLAPGEIVQHYSGRIRGGIDFCSGANGFFQGLLGDIAKSALRRVSRECYDPTIRIDAFAHENSRRSRYADGASPLYGTRVIVFQHDELLPEFPEDVAHDAATRVSEVMVEEMMHYCPDLAPAAKAPPALMRQWNKLAEPAYKVNGVICNEKTPGARLVPWEPTR